LGGWSIFSLFEFSLRKPPSGNTERQILPHGITSKDSLPLRTTLTLDADVAIPGLPGFEEAKRETLRLRRCRAEKPIDANPSALT
jgi:hypothetical protein